MEGTAVLPYYAHIPTGFDHIFNGTAGSFAVIFAVDEEHVGTLRSADGDTFEVLSDVVAGELSVAGQYLIKLVYPFVTFGFVSTDEGVHGHYVHGVGMGKGDFFGNTIADMFVVNDAVAANQTGQIEGLAGSVHGNGTIFSVFAYGLGGNMLIAGMDQVTPNFIGYNLNIVLFVQFHHFFYFPFFPNTTAGVMGRAEYGSMDVMIYDLLFHIFEIDAPDSFCVFYQRRMDDFIAAVFDATGEAYVGGGVKQNLISAGAENIKGC